MKPLYVQKMHYPRNMVVEKIIPNIHDAFSVHPVGYGLLSTDEVACERILATKIEAGRAGETPAFLLQWCISLLQVVENLLGVYLCLYFLRSEDFFYCAVFVDEICGAEGAHVFLSAHRLLSPCSELLE